MYQGKHADMQPRHPEAYRIGKFWLYSSTVLLLSAGSLSSLALPFVGGAPVRVQAATGTTQGLTAQGATVTLPAHQVTTGVANDGTPTPIGATGTASPFGYSFEGSRQANGLDMYAAGVTVPSSKPSDGAFLNNMLLDTTQPFTITTNYSGTGRNNSMLSGNFVPTFGSALGIFLSPYPQTGSISRASDGGLGIAGVDNAIFAGRDMTYTGINSSLLSGLATYGTFNTTWDNYGMLTIRSTDASGALQPPNGGTTTQWTSALATGSNPWYLNAHDTTGGATSDKPTNLSTGDASFTDTGVTLGWTPSSGTTGTLTLTDNGYTVSYTNLTLSPQMYWGYVGGATGKNGSSSLMTATTTAISATPATTPVTVNYHSGSATGPLIPSAKSDTVKADIHYLLGVGTGAAANDEYTLAAPQIAGYTFSQAASIVVSPGGTHTIDAVYTPASNNTATFSFTGATSNPAALTYSSVTTDSAMSSTLTADLTKKVPAGYYISAIKSSNGTDTAITGTDTASTIKAFLAAHPDQYNLSGTAYNYQVTLAKLVTLSATFAYGSNVNTSHLLNTSLNTTGDAPIVLPLSLNPDGTTTGGVGGTISENAWSGSASVPGTGGWPNLPLTTDARATATPGLWTMVLPDGSKIYTSNPYQAVTTDPAGNRYVQTSYVSSTSHVTTSYSSTGAKLTTTESGANSFLAAKSDKTLTSNGTYATTVSANTTPVSWTVNPSGSYAGSSQAFDQAAGAALADHTSGVIPAGYHATGWHYLGDDSGDADATVYTIFAALVAVHPYVDATNPRIAVDIAINDVTAIKTQPSDTIARTAGWTPAVELATGTQNGDGSAAQAGTVNGRPVWVSITGQGDSYSGAASTALAKNTLHAGQHTATYTALTLQGVTDYTTWQQSNPSGTVGDWLATNPPAADTKTATVALDVTDFGLPFTGGAGPVGLIAAATVAALGGAALGVRRRRGRDEESPDDDVGTDSWRYEPDAGWTTGRAWLVKPSDVSPGRPVSRLVKLDSLKRFSRHRLHPGRYRGRHAT